jgi:hypothetical protein
MWEIHGTDAEGPARTAEPLKVYSSVLPPGLPEPDEKRSDGRLAYRKGPRYALAGIFYKYIEVLDTGDETTKPQQRKYPVVLAWEMRKLSQGPIKGPANWILTGAIFLGLVLGVVVFVFLKRRIRRDKSRPSGRIFSHYRPLRDVKLAPQDTQDTDTQVDPDLIAAASEYSPPVKSEEQTVNEKEGQ